MQKALIIEDDDALREELVDLLETWGFDAVSVATGAAAHAVAGPFAVVLCDYRLQAENGIDVLRSLKLAGRPHGNAPRVFLMTGHVDLPGFEKDEIDLLGLDLLLKPVSAEVLRGAVTGTTA